MRFRPPLIAGMIGIALFHCALPASAATLNVTRFDDPVPDGCVATDCSLREAVIAANLTAAVDAILLDTGIYELTQTASGADPLSFDLDVTQPLQIIGQGSASTTIRNASPDPGPTGNALEARVMDVRQSELSLFGLNLRDGNVHGLGPFDILVGAAGCLYASQSDVALMDVTINDCKSVSNGTIFFYEVNAVFENVVIDSNIGGGAVFHDVSLQSINTVFSNNQDFGIATGGTTTLSGSGVEVVGNMGTGVIVTNGATLIEWTSGSRIAQNSTTGFGGGISVAGAQLTIAPAVEVPAAPEDLLLIEGNHADYGGGGIYLNFMNTSGDIKILNASRIALRMNTANQDGGGLYSEGKVNIRDSEFAFNSADGDGGGAWLGGNATGNLIERSSFADNHAGGAGGAVFNKVNGAKLRNVSMYSNDAQKGGGIYAATGINTYLTHVSSFSDAATQGKSLYVADNGIARVRNSALHNSCYKQDNNTPLPPGQIIDNGGNAQRIGVIADACAGSAHWSLGMSYGAFGGYFDVVGISSGSVLRNFTGPPLREAQTDVRNWDRDAQADSGAFEFGAAED